MDRRLARAAMLCVFAATAFIAFAPRTTQAQSLGDFAENGGAAAVANGNVLRDELQSRKAEKAAQKLHARHQAEANAVAQSGGTLPPPAPESLETPKPGFLHPDSPSFRYTVDTTSSYAVGRTGYPANNLPGGLDIAMYIAPTRYNRLFVGYYEESFYPIGFDEGMVPTYVQNTADGFAGLPGFPANGRSYCGAFGPSQANLVGILPNCNVDLHNVQNGTDLHFRNDAATRQRVMIFSFQNVFWFGIPFGPLKGGFLPFVVSPTYAVSHADVAGSTDVYPSYNPSTQTYSFLHLRSNEIKQVLFSLPFIDSEKLFAVYTVGPQWQMNSNGNNQQNHAQIFQVLDLRYFATPETTFFVQPGVLQSEYPVDPYPQRTFNVVTGFQHRLGGAKSPLFIQGLLEQGGPSNPPYGGTGRIGAIDVTCINDFPNCIQNPDPKKNIAVTYGGFKAQTIQLQVGFGTPSVIPL